tara:strand:+ start:372 stop:587 length:216 start_codon:yes stop_codon:yes gene_type:complete
MKMKYTGDLGGDYKENKEVFGRLKNVAKDLKLTKVEEGFNEDEENIVTGYLTGKPGRIQEVTVREVDNDNS